MKDTKIRHDPAGFPLIWVPEIGLYVHGLPITKMQFECFLCDTNDGHFDERWYEEIRLLNPRISARRVWSGNYWNAFLTGILPSEAERFAAWCGSGYRLLHISEWHHLYQALGKWSLATLEESGLLTDLAPHHRELISQVEHAVEDACAQTGDRCRMAERMLMRLGVIEWASLEGHSPKLWAGLGEPHPSFCGNLFAPAKKDLVQPADGETQRLASFGFRLALDPVLEGGRYA
jgi:hypothetical protein